MASIPISDCSVFIQLWVDDNAVQLASTQGVYAVDNNVKSSGQGSASLQSALASNQSVCWQAFLINEASTATVSVDAIGNSNAWGVGGQPQSVGSGVFTGTVINPGVNNYTVTVNVIQSNGNNVPVTLNLGVNAS